VLWASEQGLWREPNEGLCLTCGGGLLRCSSLMLLIHRSISAGCLAAFSILRTCHHTDTHTPSLAC
jgi:hypothetical protein